jgi:glycosyltransferase A (GT-A) superfamily protein (DUF2064 family)
MLPRPDDVPEVAEIVGPGWTALVQQRPGLAGALADTFLSAFDRGADRAVAVAGDALGLPPERILAAVAALGESRTSAVLGPTRDGGYHLVGLRLPSAPRWWPARLRRRARRQLANRLSAGFTDVRIGGSSALEAARRDLHAVGWRPRLLDPWPDVDTLADLLELTSVLDDHGRWAPRSGDWLARHRASIDEIAAQNPTLSLEGLP